MGHTPGPWEWRRNEHGPDRDKIGFLQGDINGQSFETVLILETFTDVKAADGLLIAAAPDLLEALEEMLKGYAPNAEETAKKEGEWMLVSCVRLAREAIRKARGKK